MPDPAENTQQQDTPWHDSIDWGGGEEFAIPEKVREFKSPAELATAYENARMKIQSKGIIEPGENATPDERAEFEATLKQKLGMEVPEKPEGYDWEPPEDLKDWFADLDDERKALHEKGVDRKTAELLLNERAEATRRAIEGIQDAQKEAAASAKAELQDKWGDTFEDRMKAVNKLKEQYPEAIEAMGANGLANSRPVLEMLDNVARSVRESAPEGEAGGDPAGAKAELAAIKGEGKTHREKQELPYFNGRHPKHAETMERVLALQKAVAGAR